MNKESPIGAPPNHTQPPGSCLSERPNQILTVQVDEHVCTIPDGKDTEYPADPEFGMPWT
jgi:hypothetical protein